MYIDELLLNFLSGYEAVEGIMGVQNSVNKCFPRQYGRTENNPNMIEKEPAWLIIA